MRYMTVSEIFLFDNVDLLTLAESKELPQRTEVKIPWSKAERKAKGTR